jgi:hypothetical protein
MLRGLAMQDVLVLGGPRYHGTDQARSARIGVVCRDGVEDNNVLAVAETLADKLQSRLHLLFAHAYGVVSTATMPTAPEPRAARVTREIIEESLPAIVAAARAARIQVLVLSRRDLAHSGASLQEFLARPGRCVVILP